LGISQQHKKFLLFGQGVGVNTGSKEHRLEKKNAPKSLSPDNLPFF
jgi:hypothetical protein